MGGDRVHDEASETDAINGAVLVDGPDGVAVLLTPGAAAETARRLDDAARDAQAQRNGTAAAGVAE
jgi:hypothetical protein